MKIARTPSIVKKGNEKWIFFLRARSRRDLAAVTSNRGVYVAWARVQMKRARLFVALRNATQREKGRERGKTRGWNLIEGDKTRDKRDVQRPRSNGSMSGRSPDAKTIRRHVRDGHRMPTPHVIQFCIHYAEDNAAFRNRRGRSRLVKGWLFTHGPALVPSPL